MTGVERISMFKDVWEEVKRQGLGFMLLIGISYYLFNKVDKLEVKMDTKQQLFIDCVQEQNAILIDVVSKNTEALKDLKND